MTTFARVATALMEGGFICQITDYEGHQFLANSVNQGDVDQYLRRIDLRLTTTRDGGAFFAAHADIDVEGKKDAKKRFTEVKNVLRPMVSFLELVMRITGDDESVAAGQVLNLNQMMARISENPSLYLQLRQTTIDINTKDGSDRERLNKIVKRFQNEGYTHLSKRSVLYKAKRKIEKAKAQVRAKVEHPFRVIKRQFGYVKTRFRGLAKNTAQLTTLFALSNLWMVRRQLLPAAGEVRP
ncbi:condensin complex protein MksE [Pseudomonas putida]|uniref:condensin complex protein MksE n=1 Tax=Pseudomonas putida TaxID=303 RepID=UPI003A76A864